MSSSYNHRLWRCFSLRLTWSSAASKEHDGLKNHRSSNMNQAVIDKVWQCTQRVRTKHEVARDTCQGLINFSLPMYRAGKWRSRSHDSWWGVSFFQKCRKTSQQALISFSRLPSRQEMCVICQQGPRAQTPKLTQRITLRDTSSQIWSLSSIKKINK